MANLHDNLKTNTAAIVNKAYLASNHARDKYIDFAITRMIKVLLPLLIVCR